MALPGPGLGRWAGSLSKSAQSSERELELLSLVESEFTHEAWEF
jgi:hypothetical protein